jgi:hypothetical protein
MNRARCNKCKDLLHSKYTHDFVSCSCGAVFIDGGDSYRRMGGEIQDIIIVRDDDTEVPLAELEAARKKEEQIEEPAKEAAKEAEHDEICLPDQEKPITLRYFCLLQAVSKGFVEEGLPNGFLEKSLERQDKWLQDNALDGFEYEGSNMLFERMEEITDEVVELLKDNGIMVSDY